MGGQMGSTANYRRLGGMRPQQWSAPQDGFVRRPAIMPRFPTPFRRALPLPTPYTSPAVPSPVQPPLVPRAPAAIPLPGVPTGPQPGQPGAPIPGFPQFPQPENPWDRDREINAEFGGNF